MRPKAKDLLVSSPLAPGLEIPFSPGLPEGDYPVRVEGEIPAFVRGSYLLNGPARFEVGGVNYRHWLDGDGCISRLGLGDEAHFTRRFLRSSKWTQEEAAGGALFRGFGTTFDGDQLVRGIATASPVNVSVYQFADRLLAFGEQGLPLELDSSTLETVGAWTFDGRLTEVTPFTGHPKIDPLTGDLMGFGVSFSASHPSLTYYRFPADGSDVVRSRIPLTGPYSIHDFAVSHNFAAFHVSPYRFSMNILREGGSVLDALDWPRDDRRSETRLLIVDRHDGTLRADLPIGNRYCLHLANAFDDGSTVTVDLLEMDRPIYTDYRLDSLLARVPPTQPVRLTVDLERGHVERRTTPCPLHLDFPAIDRARFGERTGNSWMLGISTTGREHNKTYDSLLRTDWEGNACEVLWTAPAGGFFGGEPAFIRNPDRPRAGVVLCPYHQPSEGLWGFGLWDGYEPGPPLARLLLDQGPIHLSFHSTFLPDP